MTTENQENDFNEADDFQFKDFENGLDINLDNFSSDEILFEDELETRYIKPPKTKQLPEYMLKYSNAQKLAERVILTKNDRRYYCIVNGSFIFGDFIEAIIIKNNWLVKKLTISTLSLSQNNVDSLSNLLNAEFIEELNIITSCYFYSHERNALVTYMYEKLDVNNKFQYAVADTHTKMVLIETACGKNIVIHGSANLRSSGCLEQFVIEDNEELYNFNLEYQTFILENFNTVNKMIRGKKLWNIVNSKKQ